MSFLAPYILFGTPGGGGGGFDPFTAPTKPSTGDATTSTTATNLNTISPSPGDIVLVTASQTLTSGKTISGWAGSAENPIHVLFNGFGYFNRTVTFDDMQYVIFHDLFVENSTGNGVVMTRCTDCVWNGITATNSGSNGIRVLGSTPYATANARLRFFDVTVDTWSGSDGLTFHADGNANNNNVGFIVGGLTIVGPGSDSGLDITSGKQFYIFSTDSDTPSNIGHGVHTLYLNGHTGINMICKNTDGRVVMMNFTSPGTIDLSEQNAGGIRGNDSEANPSELPNSVIDEYATYELEYLNVGTISNNSSGLGTITTLLSSDPIAEFDVSAFVV